MKPPAIYFLVLGYSTGWTTRYGAYLDKVAESWRRLNPSHVVLCGGITGKPNTEISEAEWMARRLEDLGVPRSAFRLEEESTTTIENFQCAQAQGLLARDQGVVIFCDSFRLAKVNALATSCDLDVREYLHVPIETPSLGRLVRVKSLVDAVRLKILGLSTL